jgi:hypothetical protein
MKNRSFKVGDEIICIKDHTNKLVRNGEVFTVKGFTRNPCCGSTIVDVGIPGSNPNTTCYTCQCSYKKPNGGYWFAAYIFRKIKNSSSTAKNELPEAIQERIRKHKLTTSPELIEA